MLICSIICPFRRQLYPQAPWREVSVDLILLPATSIHATIQNGTTQQMLPLIVSARHFTWVLFFFVLRPLCRQLPSELEPDVDDCYSSATRAQLLFSIFPLQIIGITLKSLQHEKFSGPSRQPTDFLSRVCLTFRKHTLVHLESFLIYLVKPEARKAGTLEPCGSSQSQRTRLKDEVNGDVSVNLTHFQPTGKKKQKEKKS